MRQEELGYPQVPLSAQVWGAIGGTGQGCDSLACGPEGATSGSCSEVTGQRDWRQRHSEGSCTDQQERGRRPVGVLIRLQRKAAEARQVSIRS